MFAVLLLLELLLSPLGILSSRAFYRDMILSQQDGLRVMTLLKRPLSLGGRTWRLLESWGLQLEQTQHHSSSKQSQPPPPILGTGDPRKERLYPLLGWGDGTCVAKNIWGTFYSCSLLGKIQPAAPELAKIFLELHDEFSFLSSPLPPL